VEIFSDKLLRRKLKLDLVVAGNAGSKHFTVTGRHRQLVLLAQGYVQIDWFWLNGGHLLKNLPFARELLFCCTAGPKPSLSARLGYPQPIELPAP
jgi:hypothetical protein